MAVGMVRPTVVRLSPRDTVAVYPCGVLVESDSCSYLAGVGANVAGVYDEGVRPVRRCEQVAWTLMGA